MSTYRWRSLGFLSDYGLVDEFVGVCHGVILALAPDVRIIDVTHGIRPGNVAQGALLLARAVSYLPPGVHLAVVDPGVGTARRAVIVETVQGSVLVGPDNGLLGPAAARLGGPLTCHCLENPELMAPTPSRTFHGRDVFAPAAAHLALGVPPSEFGSELAPSRLVLCTAPEALVAGDRCQGAILTVDHFGNLETNITAADAAQAGLRPGMGVDVQIAGSTYPVTYGETFASAAPGEAVLLEDSAGNLSLCVNQGSAVKRFSASLGPDTFGCQIGLYPYGTKRTAGNLVTGQHAVHVHDAQHPG